MLMEMGGVDCLSLGINPASSTYRYHWNLLERPDPKISAWDATIIELLHTITMCFAERGLSRAMEVAECGLGFLLFLDKYQHKLRSEPGA